MCDLRYILQPYVGPVSRIKCPSCGKPREFSRYIDRQTGQQLPDHIGRCNRELHCGYHYTPKQYFEDNKSLSQNSYPRTPTTLRTTNNYLVTTAEECLRPDRHLVRCSAIELDQSQYSALASPPRSILAN